MTTHVGKFPAEIETLCIKLSTSNYKGGRWNGRDSVVVAQTPDMIQLLSDI